MSDNNSYRNRIARFIAPSDESTVEDDDDDGDITLGEAQNRLDQIRTRAKANSQSSSQDADEIFDLLERLYRQFGVYADDLSQLAKDLRMDVEDVEHSLEHVEEELARVDGSPSKLQRTHDRIANKRDKLLARLETVENRRIDVDIAVDDLDIIAMDLKTMIVNGEDLTEDIETLRSVVEGDTEDIPVTKQVEHACESLDDMVPDDGRPVYESYVPTDYNYDYDSIEESQNI